MILARNNVRDTGEVERRPLVFVHGFGCDQSMWRDVVQSFTPDFRIVTYDLTGMGGSDLSEYEPRRYAKLDAHAEDLLDICAHLDLKDAIIVGHSIGATIAVLAANMAPERMKRLILVSPSPSFLEDPATGYNGGYSREDLDGLVKFLDENHLGWSHQMAPTIVGQDPDAPAAIELTQSFCRTDPRIARHFGHVTFFADRRADFERLERPALIIHCNQDALVPMDVAWWMRDHIPESKLEILQATGHCPHMTVPTDAVSAMRNFLEAA
ncbi:Sigma factor SigB regulation protein RsbQ [Defluviimonas aquaemixtae]|uniref:Sigma factor SigB regulation protein RsbQ n=1 Tax=Albidovulum aquaemixtae TaxID=1542388 RepID=A0A2R8B7Q7_9RHOB|nr:alpha/beta hydrolase [Defluviimonas aquaemixtae]SPH18661.1 Sigma factor SigB regulation protein RsbQ [Defluviimonas aquaemixtae]